MRSSGHPRGPSADGAHDPHPHYAHTTFHDDTSASGLVGAHLELVLPASGSAVRSATWTSIDAPKPVLITQRDMRTIYMRLG
jgi:hypothetical protein